MFHLCLFVYVVVYVVSVHVVHVVYVVNDRQFQYQQQTTKMFTDTLVIEFHHKMGLSRP